MVDWWESPYKGGPMVPVPGFPRQLQVGDPDGPDAVAYKRTVWRSCRWQGPASRFDDTYSHGFAHGKPGGNVSDTGVAWVQRQQNMPDTGVVDMETFNTLRSIRVPEGKPHAGEMAMDVTAANLIGEAWQKFHPPPKPKQTTRERALDGAIGWLGTTETPAGSNQCEFTKWYGMVGPWCAMFVTYCYEVEAGGSPSFARSSRYAYVPYVVSDAGAARNGLTITSTPHPGDLVCFDWERDGTFDHIGLFESGTATTFTAIEGNTSTSNNSNGGAVMRRDRSTQQASIVFVRVAE
jgi:hypothetical protein